MAVQAAPNTSHPVDHGTSIAMPLAVIRPPIVASPDTTRAAPISVVPTMARVWAAARLG